MGIKTRQEKANEIRDLITQINGRISELREDGYRTTFTLGDVGGYVFGKFTKVNIEKIVKL